MLNYIIEEKRDYTKGLTALEFSIIRGEIAQQMYSGINDIDCDDCQSADDMHWHILEIYEEEFNDGSPYYTVHGTVNHDSKYTDLHNCDTAEFYASFSQSEGLFSQMVIPSEE